MLKTRQLIPPLTARTAAGRIVRAWDYKQKKNLVLVFLHAGCERCAQYLARLAERAPALGERNAIALVIFSEAPPVARSGLAAEIIIGADMTGRTHRAYFGEDAFGTAGQQFVGVFVADRYGELYAQWVGRAEDELPDVGLVLSWLGQIEVACEECGVSHWPVDS